MFDPIMQQILAIARDAWAFLSGLLIVVALLGGLYYVLQGTAGAAFGASRMTSMATRGAVPAWLDCRTSGGVAFYR